MRPENKREKSATPQLHNQKQDVNRKASSQSTSKMTPSISIMLVAAKKLVNIPKLQPALTCIASGRWVISNFYNKNRWE